MSPAAHVSSDQSYNLPSGSAVAEGAHRHSLRLRELRRAAKGRQPSLSPIPTCIRHIALI